MNIKIYGSRGSIPFFSRDSIVYGGNTPCAKIETGGRTLIFDCGSGLMQFLNEYKRHGGNKPLCLDIFISHLHIDHIIGLCMFSPLWSREHSIRIFTQSRDERPLAEQVFGLFRPPYWPIDLVLMNRAQIIGIENGETLSLGDSVDITPFASNHNNITTAFRIHSKDSKKTAVHMLDYATEKDLSKHNEDIRRCKDADVVIYDSSYLPEDYPERQTWGHSIYSDGIAFAEKARCKNMIFCHFDQKYADTELGALAAEIERINNKGADTKYFVGYDGMELDI